MAVLALGEAGPAAGDAVLALVAALGDESEVVRRRVAVALGEIGTAARAALPALAEVATRDASAGVRRAAAFAVAAIGPPAAANRAAA
jgi:HEAT repeat protein